MHILMFFALAFADCGPELTKRFEARALRINPALDTRGASLEDYYVLLKREAERPEPVDAELRQHLEENFGRHFVIGEGEEATRFYRNSLWNLRAAVARKWLTDTAAPIATEHGLEPAFVARVLDSFFEPAGYLVSLEGPGLLADDVERVFHERPWVKFPWTGATRADDLFRLERARQPRLARDGHTCCQNHAHRCQICPLNYYWHKDPRNPLIDTGGGFGVGSPNK